MPNNDVAIVILAAGKGTRLKSSLAKVLHRAGGRTLVEHIVRSCQPLKQRFTLSVFSNTFEQFSSEDLRALADAGFRRIAQLRQSVSKPSRFKKGHRALNGIH